MQEGGRNILSFFWYDESIAAVSIDTPDYDGASCVNKIWNCDKSRESGTLGVVKFNECAAQAKVIERIASVDTEDCRIGIIDEGAL